MATDRKQLSTWVTEEEAERIARVAAREHRTVSALIRIVMLAMLEEKEEVAA